MKTLSIPSSPPSRLLARIWHSRRWRKAPALAVTDPFAATPGGHGMRWPVSRTQSLFVERICILAVLTSLALYVVAAFLANEWLYLLSAALVLSAVLSAILPLLITSTVRAHATLPQYGAAAESAEIVIRISQSSWLGPLKFALPLACMRVRPALARRTAMGYQLDASTQQQIYSLDSAGEGAVIKLRIAELNRGVYKLSHLDVATCMPFGLAWAIAQVRITEDKTKNNSLVVMPQVVELRGTFLEALRGIYSPVGMRFANVRAFSQSTSVRALRDFRTGDSLRHIHWPTSARLNRLLVREFDSETLPLFNLYIDLGAHWQNRQQFELAVCLIYSLVHFGYDHDMLPEVLVHPPLDSPDVEGLMCDLPHMKAPMDMLGEIMARVDPLQRTASKGGIDSNSRYQTLAAVPSKEVMLIAAGETAPVNLVVVDPDHSLEEGTVLVTVYGEKDLRAL